ncbi:hypothetical protein D3C81_1746750 [compost metagenome]
MLAKTDQRIAGTFARTAAFEAQRLDIEQAYGVFVIEAVQQGFVGLSPLLRLEGVGQGNHMLPTVLALFFITLAIHRQLLQQQAASLAALGVEPEARVELLRLHEVVGEAL